MSTDDPLRLTLEVAIRAPKDQTTTEELEKLERYLVNYRAAPTDLIAATRLPAYDTLMLDSLINTVRQLAHYYGSGI